jgi:hypothetical protein
MNHLEIENELNKEICQMQIEIKRSSINEQLEGLNTE